MRHAEIEAGVITVDVFDTLVIRRPVAQRRRFFRYATALARAQHWDGAAADALYATYDAAYRLAFRANRLEPGDAEVQLLDLIEKISRLAGLPAGPEALERQLALWVEEEVRGLVPNRALAGRLARARARGARTYALSDTALPARAVEAILGRVLGAPPVERVHTSADAQATKRRGGLFGQVAEAEGHALAQTLHIGDDARADLERPASLGIAVERQPVRRDWALLRRLDGLAFELARRLAPRGRRALRARTRRLRASVLAEPAMLGPAIFGPVVAEIALRLWFYLAGIAAPKRTVALFCARGGLRMRRALALLATQLGLAIPVRCQDFMVSRLVAARLAFARDPARAIAELAHDFSGERLGAAAEALAGQKFPLGPDWDRPFEASRLAALLEGPEGAAIRAEILAQARLFEEYVRQAIGTAERVILVDTGLYGSTLRLLAIGMPDVAWEGVQIARCNYRRADRSHFARLTGLLVERDGYNPFERETIILRFWHLFEALFEPGVETVRQFQRLADGRILSNLEASGGLAAIGGPPGSLFAGVEAYLRGLRPGAWLGVREEAELAWRYLSGAIRYPRAGEIGLLDPGQRSRDFGLVGAVGAVAAAATLRDSLSSIRGARWREGTAAHNFRRLRAPVLLLLDGLTIALSLWRLAR